MLDGPSRIEALVNIFFWVVLSAGRTMLAASPPAPEPTRALHSAEAYPVTAPMLGATLELEATWVDGRSFPSSENHGVSRTFQELWSTYLQPAGINILRFPVDIRGGDTSQSIRLANLCLWARGAGVELVPILTSGDMGDLVGEDFPGATGRFVRELASRLMEGGSDAYPQIRYYQVGYGLNHPALRSTSPVTIVRRAAAEISRAEGSVGLGPTPLLVGLSLDYELLALGAAPSGTLSDETYEQALRALREELRQLADLPDVSAISVDWLPGSLSAGTAEDISRLAESLRSESAATVWISTGLSTGFSSQEDQSQYYASVLRELGGPASAGAPTGGSLGLFLRDAIDRISAGLPRPAAFRGEEFTPQALSQSLLRISSDPRAVEHGTVTAAVQWWLEETNSNLGFLQRTGGGFVPKEAYESLLELAGPTPLSVDPGPPYLGNRVVVTSHDPPAQGAPEADEPGVFEQELDHLKGIGTGLALELLDAYLEKLRNKLLPEGSDPGGPDPGYGTYSDGTGPYGTSDPAPGNEGAYGVSEYPIESDPYDDSTGSPSASFASGDADLRIQDVQIVTGDGIVRARLFNGGVAEALRVGAYLMDGYSSVLTESTIGTVAAGSSVELELSLLSLGRSELREVRLAVYCDNESNPSDNELLLGDIQVSEGLPTEGNSSTGTDAALAGSGGADPDSSERQRERESSAAPVGRIRPLPIPHTIPLGNSQEEIVAARKVPLYSWYSSELGDNFATSDPAWSDQVGSTSSMGDRMNYRFVRIEGFVFDPNGAQPAGTIPVYSWWSPERGDAFLTTDPGWAGNPGDRKVSGVEYRFDRLEGFIYPTDGPRPRGAIPLYSWYSEARGDNFATTDSRWAGRPGETKAHGPGLGYRFVRIEGYLPQ